jgi:hypothetical protein
MIWQTLFRRIATNASGPLVMELSGDQLNSIKIAPVGTYRFSVEKAGIGNMDFQDDLYSDSPLSRQIFPPETGIISRIP